MARPIVYDMTYVVARLDAPAPTGIERVDAAYARHFAARAVPEADPGETAAAVHYGLRRPHRWTAATARRLMAAAGGGWRDTSAGDADPVFDALAAWLAAPPAIRLRAAPPAPGAGARLIGDIARHRWRLADDPRAEIPARAIYLNVAQYAFEYPFFFRWLDRRPDIAPVFFVHDLLPLDTPEFFRAGYRDLFARRVATMARYARAAIVSSEAVATRLQGEMRRHGRPALPLHVAPLPPPARMGAPIRSAGAGPLAAAAPYFVAIGTIEPRKNHLLLLNVWRALALAGGTVPRLVLVGSRGWDNEQVIDLLDRSSVLAPHVAEVSGLGTRGLRQVVANARALLMPSFDEGYGLPLAEALAEQTPTLASDIPVFRDVSQQRALLLDPTDGPGWRDAIASLARPASPLRRSLLAKAGSYVAPGEPDYFASVEAFLNGL